MSVTYEGKESLDVFDDRENRVRSHRHGDDRIRTVPPLHSRKMEVLTAMLLEQGVTLGEFATFLGWMTPGNIVGGSVFVGLLNYGHVALAGEQQNIKSNSKTVE